MALDSSDDEQHAEAEADGEPKMFYYPEGSNSGRVKITRADCRTLGAGNMLNDSVIDFYLKWIETKMVRISLDFKSSSGFIN